MSATRSLQLLVPVLALTYAGSGSSPRSVRGGAPAAAADVVGTWRLASLVSIRESGEAVVGWRGPQPTGLLVYQSDGAVAVQIVRDPRARMSAADAETAPVQEKAQAFDAYYAYFGRYELEGAKGLLRHVVENSLWPNEVGHTYQHRFRLAGDSLTLDGRVFEAHGEKVHSRLLWVRARSPQ